MTLSKNDVHARFRASMANFRGGLSTQSPHRPYFQSPQRVILPSPTPGNQLGAFWNDVGTLISSLSGIVKTQEPTPQKYKKV